MANYLVTGGAGFIGSNIVESLARQNASVRVLDNCSTGKLTNLEEFLGKIEFVDGDICNLSVVREAVKDIDYVIHQAALPSVTRSIRDPITTNNVNATGTLNILVAAKNAKVKRVIYASSSSVYGNTPALPKREEMAANPTSPYAITKYAGEQYCKVFFELYGLEAVVLRYFNVFGPKQDPDSPYAAAIPSFICAYLSGKPPTIYGDGRQSRDFTFVENVVQANLFACQTKEAAGRSFNIACGKSTTINELAKLIKDFLGSQINPVKDSPRWGEVRHSLADISKARKILGYEPEVDLENGLWKTIEWFQANGNFILLDEQRTDNET